MANRKISQLTALTTPAAGDYLPIVDISEAADADKNKRITIEELLRGAPDGTAAAPSIAFESDPDSGLYSTGANGLALATGGTGRLFVDSSGKVGLGTSSPDALLTVNGVGAHGLGSAAAPSFAFTGDLNTGIYSPGANEVAISTNGGERARVDSSGNLIIGKTVPDNATVGITFFSTGVGSFVADGSRSGTFVRKSSDGSVVEFRRDGATVGSISVTTSATAYNTSSDYRLKENIVSLTGAADRLNQLQVHRFNFIADPDKTVDGFIAHEAQAVVPECVTGIKDEVDDEGNPVYQGIDQSKLVPLVVAALQEALAEIETLKAEVAALKAS